MAGDMTMTGIALEPVGPMKLETLIDIYKEQARYSGRGWGRSFCCRDDDESCGNKGCSNCD